MSADGGACCFVFPAGAGVFPWSLVSDIGNGRVPRRCGGVPGVEADIIRRVLCSPQVRGCSYGACFSWHEVIVFPAGAGVFLTGKIRE